MGRMMTTGVPVRERGLSLVLRMVLKRLLLLGPLRRRWQRWF